MSRPARWSPLVVPCPGRAGAVRRAPLRDVGRPAIADVALPVGTIEPPEEVLR